MSNNNEIGTNVDQAVSLESKKLGLKELVAMGTGQVIGAGVVTLVGVAIPVTGRSVWLAFATAVLAGFVIILPYIFLSSMMKVKGGNYTFVSKLLGDRWGGMYGIAFLLDIFAISMVALGFGTYINALLPGVNIQIAAILVITLFWMSSLMGVGFIAKIQKTMMVVLFIGMGSFIVTGLLNVNRITFDFGAPDFFSGGFNGFASAVMILIFSCKGQSFAVAFSGDAKDAKKNVPLAIIIATGIILVLYPLVAIVASGVLPIEQVANKPLTLVAETLFPPVIYYTFIITGPLMVLMTTVNSFMGVFPKVLAQMSRDGWFPKSVAKQNKHGSPSIAVTIVFLLALLPIIAGLDIKTITSNVVLITRFSDIIATIAVIIIPTRLVEAWDNRYFKISKSAFYVFMVLSLIMTSYIMLISLQNLNTVLIAVTMLIIVSAGIYTLIRQKSGKVSIEKSYDLE